jgi:hypothetical protein
MSELKEEDEKITVVHTDEFKNYRVVARCVAVTNYRAQRDECWPRTGRVIMAQFTEDAVLVYQSYNREIADFAVANGKFLGAPGWKDSRMTWIKTSFLWMMHRNGWGSKHNQEATLGIWLKRTSFERILSHTREVGSGKNKESNDEREFVRLQWDPSHAPGDKGKHIRNGRRDIQLGLKNVKGFANGDDIVHIVDLSEFVAEQAAILEADGDEELETPVERPYPVDKTLLNILGIHKVEPNSKS